ncbi:MAG: hypothetical protein H6702_05450 [Myxococcales bacterium]|nr:hypothetical protein [Myxococcales bacterium]
MPRFAFAAPLLLLTGCFTGPISHVRVETGAESMEQPTVGQALLAGAPIPDDDHGYGVRLTVGGGLGLPGGPAQTPDGAALHTGSPRVGGLVTVNAGGVEIGLTAGGQTRRTVNRGVGGQGGLSSGGLRLRVAPGGERFRVNLAAEVGGRVLEVSQGQSMLCDVAHTPEPGVFGPVPGGTCWQSSARAGTPDWDLVGYATASVYPALRLAEGVWLFGGVGVDTVLQRYEAEEVWVLYGGQASYVETEATTYAEALAGVWLAGLDVHVSEHLGVLVNVRGGAFGAEIGPPAVEGAVSFMF